MACLVFVLQVAAQTQSPNVILLEGVGVGPGATTAIQSAFQLPLFTNLLEYLKANNASETAILNVQQQVLGNTVLLLTFART